jgi:hypothetical protein
MSSCSPNNISIDANEIAMLIFSNEEIESDYKSSLISSFDQLDVKTYFEMLLLVTTEGMKTYFGDRNMQVNIANITHHNIEYMNLFLKKINIKLIINIYKKTDLENLDIKQFSEIKITNRTKLNELNFIIQRGDCVVISFEKI